MNLLVYIFTVKFIAQNNFFLHYFSIIHDIRTETSRRIISTEILLLLRHYGVTYNRIFFLFWNDLPKEVVNATSIQSLELDDQAWRIIPYVLVNNFCNFVNTIIIKTP